MAPTMAVRVPSTGLAARGSASDAAATAPQSAAASTVWQQRNRDMAAPPRITLPPTVAPARPGARGFFRHLALFNQSSNLHITVTGGGASCGFNALNTTSTVSPSVTSSSLSSAIALQRCDDCRVIACHGSLERRGTAGIRSVRIGAIHQQRGDRVGLTMQRRQHQGGAARSVA